MFDVPGYRVVRVLGAVYGLTVRSRNWAASLGMVLKSMAGGELRWFTNMVFLPPYFPLSFFCIFCCFLFVFLVILFYTSFNKKGNECANKRVAEDSCTTRGTMPSRGLWLRRRRGGATP